MIIGELMRAADDTIGGIETLYYSPWFASRGNAATFACEVTATFGMSNLYVDVQTKKRESSDKDQGATTPLNGTANTITLTANVTTTFKVGASLDSTSSNGLLELVRFRYRLMATEGNAGKAFVHLRILNPAWLTN